MMWVLDCGKAIFVILVFVFGRIMELGLFVSNRWFFKNIRYIYREGMSVI